MSNTARGHLRRVLPLALACATGACRGNLEQLLGREVRARNGQRAGRIDELRAA